MFTKYYEFESKIWTWHANSGQSGAWYLVSLPKETYVEIKEIYGWSRRGFGSIPVLVTIGESTWKTSIFPSKELGTYILPIKASIRKAEKLRVEDTVKIKVEIK